MSSRKCTFCQQDVWVAWRFNNTESYFDAHNRKVGRKEERCPGSFNIISRAPTSSTTSETPTPASTHVTGTDAPASTVSLKNGRTYRLHPACAAFPQMDPPRLQALADSIAKVGQQDYILMLGDEVLDGRNRLLACDMVGVEPKIQKLYECPKFSLALRDPVSWVAAHNLERRDLTVAQRAMIAARLQDVRDAAAARHAATRRPTEPAPVEVVSNGHLEHLLEACEQLGRSPVWILGLLKLRLGELEEAETFAGASFCTVRGCMHLADGPGSTLCEHHRAKVRPPERPDPPADLTPRRSADEAGARMGVSGASVERARAVLATGTRELVAAVESGVVDLTAGATLAKAPADVQRTVDLTDRKAVKAAAKSIADEERAARQVKERQRQAELARQAAVQAVAITDDIDLRHAPCSHMIEQLKTAGVAVPLIMADPPWTYRNGIGNGVARNHYEMMGMKEILDDVDASFEIAGTDAYLVLWCTSPMLADFFEAITSRYSFRWKYKTAMAWVKTGGIGIGHHVRGDHEHLFVFTKGNPRPIDNAFSSVWSGPRTEHSEKPEAYLAALLEAYTVPGARVVDLYAGRAPLARAARRTGRLYVGAELDPERIAQARAGLAAATPDPRQMPLLETA